MPSAASRPASCSARNGGKKRARCSAVISRSNRACASVEVCASTAATSGSPTASSSVTMQQVRLSAPAPPRSSESASVRSPICAAWSSSSTSSGRARASRRCGLSASGLITSATNSRTVSRICNCSALKRRSYMWLLRKLTGLDTTSLALDARGLDHARPFLQILADELAETIGAERKRRDLLLGELLDHLRVMHDRERLLGEPLHDLLRRPRRRYDADPRRHFESRHRLGAVRAILDVFATLLIAHISHCLYSIITQCNRSKIGCLIPPCMVSFNASR